MENMENNKIVALRGPDRVRKRPAVVFTSDDIEGVKVAVENLLRLFAEEALYGRCTQLNVRQCECDLEISSNDRGLYLGQDTGDERIWKQIFCELYPMPVYPTCESGYCFGLENSTHHALFGEPSGEHIPCYPEETDSFDLCTARLLSRAIH